MHSVHRSLKTRPSNIDHLSRPGARRHGLWRRLRIAATLLAVLGAWPLLATGPAAGRLAHSADTAEVLVGVTPGAIRLNVSDLSGLEGRVSLVLPEIVPGLTKSDSFRMWWRTQGVLRSGTARPGDRVLLFEGRIDDQMLSDLIDWTFEVRAVGFERDVVVAPRFEFEAVSGQRTTMQVVDGVGRPIAFALSRSVLQPTMLRVESSGLPGRATFVPTAPRATALRLGDGANYLSVQPSAGGMSVQSAFRGLRVTLGPSYSEMNGMALQAGIASVLGRRMALGVVGALGGDRTEGLVNFGVQLDARNRLILTSGQLRQGLDMFFPSGLDATRVTQNQAGLSYQLALTQGILRQLEFEGYFVRADSLDLEDRVFSPAGSPGFLMLDPRRVAGGRIAGSRALLMFAPRAGTQLRASLGAEQLTYYLSTASESTLRTAGGVQMRQQLPGLFDLRIEADAGASQYRYTAGLARATRWRQGADDQLAVVYTAIRGRDGAPNDNQVRLDYTFGFGNASSPATRHVQAGAVGDRPASYQLLENVIMRPAFLPMQVVARQDSTAVATPVPVPGTGGGGGASPRSTPTPFEFAEQTGLATGIEAVSNPITVAGLDGPAAISIENGEYSIDGGPFTSAAGIINNGQVVVVRHITSTSFGGIIETTLTIGGFSTVFRSVALQLNLTPDSFSIPAELDVPLDTLIVSAPVTVTGVGAGVDVSVANGEYSIDDGPYTESPGTVGSGQVVRVRHRSATTPATTVESVLTIGGVSATFASTTIAVGTPDPFSFLSLTGAPLATVMVSNVVTIAGSAQPVPVSISGGEYSINGGAFTSAPDTVESGQSVQVRVLSSAFFSTATTAVLTAGPTTASFTVTTLGPPASFGFDPQVDVPLTAVIVSNALTISGVSGPTPMSVAGGEYSIDGGPFTGTPGTVRSGQSVRVRHTSSAAFSTATTTTLNIGGVEGTFTSTTLGLDGVPDRFTFVDQTNVPLNTLVESNAVTVTGINTAVPIAVNDGEYSVDGGGYTATPGTVSAGQTVRVRQTSAGEPSTATHTVLTIGGVSDTFSVSTVGADTTPDGFTFTDQTGVPLSTSIESNAITVSDINTAAAISVTGGDYSIDGAAFTAVPGTVTAGQSVKVRQTSAATASTTTNTTLTIGGVSDTFSVTTLAIDTTPDPFGFANQAGVPRNTVITSNVVTVTGINAPAAISISAGGEYSINGGAFTGVAGTVTNGQTVTLRQTSHNGLNQTTTVTVTIGGVAEAWSVSTAPEDTTPDAFVFTDQIGVALSTLVESNSITVSGINTAAAISVTGGEYSINGGAFTSAAGNVDNGDTVKVRQTSSASPSTTTNTVLTIGGVFNTFSVTTVGADTTPDDFTFTDLTAVAKNTELTSNTITVSGINVSTPISISAGGSYSINGAGYTSGAGNVTNGQTVTLRQTSDNGNNKTTTVTLNIGGVTKNWSVTTGSADTTPDAFSFTAQTNVALSTQVESNTITVGGIDSSSPVTVTGGEYSINGGGYASGAGSVNNGDTVKVRQTSSASNSTTTNTVLTIGGIAGTFSVTTVAAPADDPTPDAFMFTDQNPVPKNTEITSNTITVAGINVASPISISAGGSYSINGAGYTSGAGTVTNGQTVTLRQTSDNGNNKTTTVTLNIGGVTDEWSVTTGSADTTPDAFSFTAQTNVALSTQVESNTITVGGIDSPSAVTVTGGEYSINGGGYTSAAGSISNGDTVKVRQTSSASNSTTTSTVLTIGGVSGTFSVTTVAADTTPDAFSFTAQTGVAKNVTITSNTITISGITAAAAISISGHGSGRYSINGGAYVNSAGTVNNGDTVTLQMTSSGAANTLRTVTLTIGGVSTTWNVTTGS